MEVLVNTPGRQLGQRIAEARETGKLNCSYLGAAGLQDAISQALAAALPITELDLSSNALSSESLPPAVARLTRLRVLRLKYNQLTRLPVALLAQLPQLSELELDGNQIASVEEEALPQLAALQRLSLSSNGLAALPDSISRCRALEVLSASNNPLTQLPDSLGFCPSLTHLDVSSCRLVALPASLAQCRTLQRLFCQNNFLPKVPTCMGHLSGTLKEWNLRANRLPLKYEQARERGLAKFLAFLRDEEEIERLQEIERNRPVGIACGPCTVYRCKVVLEDALAAAAAGESTAGFAWIRQGHAACLHKNSVYVFGGLIVAEGRKTAELLVLDTDRMEWRVQPTRGDRPCPRDGHVMVVDPSGAGQLIVFGGRKEAGGRRLNDLYFLDLGSWTWFAPKQERDFNALPPPREQAAAVFADGRLVLFGGRTNGARLNDLWAFDVATFHWEQLVVQGSAPSPRQGAAACIHEGKLWVMGGTSHYVLDECHMYAWDTQEWKSIDIHGKNKTAARAGGHIITHCQGALWMFGGQDALGAQVPMLLKLKNMGGSRFEWVETEFSMLPNRSRVVLFDSDGHLAIMQAGHPLHKLSVSADQIERGRVLWDVTQVVPLAAVKEREVQSSQLAKLSPKQERIHHTSTQLADKLPHGFTTHTPREQQVLAAAAAFQQRWAEVGSSGGEAGARLAPCITLLNECGVEKAVCTTLRPTSLPHIELHDLEGIAQFVSEFFNYEPLEDPCKLPTHLVSPYSLLEWQAGDSFDLATLACSLLLGAGYSAYMVVGYVPKEVALNDRSRTECPWLAVHGLEAPPYAELPELEPSFQEAAVEQVPPEAAGSGSEQAGEGGPQPAAAGDGDGEGEGGPAGTGSTEQGSCGAATAAAASDTDCASTSGGGDRLAAGSRPSSSAAAQGRSTPQPEQPADVMAATGADAADGKHDEVEGSAAASGGSHLELLAPPASSQRKPKRHVHAFVLVKPGKREVAQPLLLDPGTGILHSMEAAPCTGVEFAWSDSNFWCNLQHTASGSSSTDATAGGCHDHRMRSPADLSWTFSDPNCWLPLLIRKEEHLHLSDVCTEVSMHSSQPSDSLLHPRHHAIASTSSPLLGRLTPSASRAWSTPRGQHTSAAVAGAAVLAAASAATPTSSRSSRSTEATPPGRTARGIGLHHLANGAGAPLLGGMRELADFSVAYLSPDHSSCLSPPAHTGMAPSTSGALVPGSASASGRAPAGSPATVAPATGQSSAAATTPTSTAGLTAASAVSSVARPPVSVASQLPAPPDMPLSWVPKLVLSRERLDMRCPKGQKTQRYRQCRRDLYAQYGECGRWDGLVERLTTYSDADCSATLCVLELFSRRKDRLVWRQTYPAQRLTIDSFESGAAACLKSLRVLRGGEVCQLELDATFFPDRADGLIRRRHCGGVSTEEWFLPGSRPDGLVHRVAKYAAAPTSAAQGQLAAEEGAGACGGRKRGSQQPCDMAHRSSAVTSWEPEERVPASIREQYSWPCGSTAGSAAAAAPPAERLVGRLFDLEVGRLQLFMCGEPAGVEAQAGEVATVTRTYDLDGALLEQVSSEQGYTAPGLSPEQQRREYAALKAASRAAQAVVRGAEEEIRAIFQARLRHQQSTTLVTPHYDAPRAKVEDSDNEVAAGPGDDEDDSYDFLLHFLPHTGARDMTAAEAEQARADCLSAFDDRMACRSSLLRARLAEGTAELERLRAVLANELHHMSPADQARVQQEEAAAAFRLRVAQRRTDEHAVQAAAKRRALEARLDGDKRLMAALASGQ